MINQFLYIFRNKRKFKSFFLLIISCLLFVFFLLMALNYYYFNSMNNIERKIENRSVMINSDEFDENFLSEIFNYRGVEKVYKFYDSIPVNVFDKNYYFNYKSSEDLNDNNVIISNELALEITNKTKEKKIVGRDYEFKINGKIYNFLISGIHNNKNSSELYVSLNTMERFSVNNNLKNKGPYIVILNSYFRVNEFCKQMSKEGIVANLYNDTGVGEIKFFSNIMMMFEIIIFFNIIIIFATMICITKNIIREEKKDIAILKTLGYSKYEIVKILLYRLWTICIYAFVVSLSLILLILFMLYIFNFIPNLFVYNDIFLVAKIIFLLLFICIFIPSISILFSLRKVISLDPKLLFIQE